MDLLLLVVFRRQIKAFDKAEFLPFIQEVYGRAQGGQEGQNRVQNDPP